VDEHDPGPHPDPFIRALLDRAAVTEVLHRYAWTLDAKDYAGLREVFADDAVARYGDRDWMEGGDAIVAWIAGHGREQAAQHHHVSVYLVELDGDVATALSYVTARNHSAADAGAVAISYGSYRDELRREAGGWRITRRQMVVTGREQRRT
jgi:ketosteroid isomerase-like protein